MNDVGGKTCQGIGITKIRKTDLVASLYTEYGILSMQVTELTLILLITTIFVFNLFYLLIKSLKFGTLGFARDRYEIKQI